MDLIFGDENWKPCSADLVFRYSNVADVFALIFYRLLHEDEIRREERGQDGEMIYTEFYAKVQTASDVCLLPTK